MEGGVGAVGATSSSPRRQRSHQRRVDALAARVCRWPRGRAPGGRRGRRRRGSPPRTGAGEQPEDGHLGDRQPLGEGLGLAQQQLAGALLAAAQAAQLARAAALVDLQGDQDLVLLGRGRGGLDQLDVGADEVGVERDGAVALGLQVGGELVGLAGQGALDPLQAADRAAVAPAARQHRAPGVERALLLGGVAQGEGAGAHRDRGGVGAARGGRA